MLTDSFGRTHDYLRISLTDNCNLRCFYCMPEEEYDFTPASRLMQAEEIEALARIFTAHGVRKIRLTGGEPLVRKDAARIIEALGNLPVKLTLTTNGVRVHDFIPVLEAVGVRSLNISLDTLNADKFLLMTRRDVFGQVRRNIDLLLEKGMEVKINVVVIHDLNDSEIIDFVSWTKDIPIEVRFIEFMPFTGNRWSSNRVVTQQEILDLIAKQCSFAPMARGAHDTATPFRAEGHKGTFAVIGTMSAPFCSGCNRLRLTADGKLKNCLFSASETDLLGPLRRGESIEPLIADAVRSKAAALGGQLDGPFQQLEAHDIANRSMITIGG